jgi:hypothetical protein
MYAIIETGGKQYRAEPWEPSLNLIRYDFSRQIRRPLWGPQRFLRLQSKEKLFAMLEHDPLRFSK